ncbi:hypothetical protein QE152_g40637 [Popillia japonica]|uniref:Uncharacterized protein n=1 Tax=Popillia japonica TaxID=7064 RepID=A0AAW1HFQ3_POPJA
MDVIQEPPIKRKRGVVNPSKYQRNRIKSSRSQGKEYVNYKGHVVHAKAIGNSCNCPLKCFQKVNEENRNNVFKTFYGIATKNEQDIYLQDLLQPRTSTSCLELPTEKAYKGPLPIGIVKLDNIKTLLRWVDEEHKEYYHNILRNHPPKDEKVKKNKK